MKKLKRLNKRKKRKGLGAYRIPTAPGTIPFKDKKKYTRKDKHPGIYSLNDFIKTLRDE